MQHPDCVLHADSTRTQLDPPLPARPEAGGRDGRLGRPRAGSGRGCRTAGVEGGTSFAVPRGARGGGGERLRQPSTGQRGRRSMPQDQVVVHGCLQMLHGPIGFTHGEGGHAECVLDRTEARHPHARDHGQLPVRAEQLIRPRRRPGFVEQVGGLDDAVHGRQPCAGPRQICEVAPAQRGQRSGGAAVVSCLSGRDGERGQRRVVDGTDVRRGDHRLQQRTHLRKPPLVPADRQQVRGVPEVRIDVAGTTTALGAVRRHPLRLVEPSGPDGRQNVDRGDHEPDCQVIGLGEQATQFREMPDGVRFAGKEEVDSQPEQPRQQVDPPPRAGTDPDEFERQRSAQRPMVGPHQAVVRQVERLGVCRRILTEPRLVEDGEDRVVPARAVVELGSQPRAEPQGSDRGGVGPLQCAPQRLGKGRGRRSGALFLRPQAGEAERTLGRRPVITGDFRHPVSRSRRPTDGAQVPGLVHRSLSLDEQPPGRLRPGGARTDRRHRDTPHSHLPAVRPTCPHRSVTVDMTEVTT